MYMLDVLTGHVNLLKLSFVRVVNRSQWDIDVDRSMFDALECKADSFRRHLRYRNVMLKNGMKTLAKVLNQVCALPFMRLLVSSCAGYSQRYQSMLMSNNDGRSEQNRMQRSVPQCLHVHITSKSF
jgi:hypothetical protein